MFVGKTARSLLLLVLYQSNSNGKGDCLWRSRPRILRVSRQILSSAPANGCEENAPRVPPKNAARFSSGYKLHDCRRMFLA